ncbi:MAG: hypothetical protein R2695_01700 [Acidimicrobiales bacterium]
MAIVAVVAVGAAALDLTGRSLPGHRQVDERWLTSYRGWVYGFGFGAQLGFGLVTVVNTALMAAVVVAGILVSAPAALLLGALYGAVRAAGAVGGGRVRSTAAAGPPRTAGSHGDDGAAGGVVRRASSWPRRWPRRWRRDRSPAGRQRRRGGGAPRLGGGVLLLDVRPGERARSLVHLANFAPCRPIGATTAPERSRRWMPAGSSSW